MKTTGRAVLSCDSKALKSLEGETSQPQPHCQKPFFLLVSIIGLNTGFHFTDLTHDAICFDHTRLPHLASQPLCWSPLRWTSPGKA